jgi:hypothetical protein
MDAACAASRIERQVSDSFESYGKLPLKAYSAVPRVTPMMLNGRLQLSRLNMGDKAS